MSVAKITFADEEVRYELASRGWFEGLLHDNGRYLILNMDKFNLNRKEA